MRSLKFYKPSIFYFLLPVLFIIILHSCNNKEHKDVSEKQIVEKPEDINASAEEIIQETLNNIVQNDKNLPDSFKVKNASVLQYIYDQNSFQPIWSSKGNLTALADSLRGFIDSSKKFGLFPNDYDASKLASLKIQLADTSKDKKLNASLWAYNDLLYSSAFVQLVKDVKAGRLLPDSVIAKDTFLTKEFFNTTFNYYRSIFNKVFLQLEPKDSGYQKLKLALQKFLREAKFKNYTYVSAKDSSFLFSVVYKRLSEEDSTLGENNLPDSLQLSAAIKKYQKKKNIKQDGKLSQLLIDKLNNTDKEKFIRIAINLDRYKLLPPLSDLYIWVNVPSYYLQLRQGDSVLLKSRVVVGKPTTQTPIITSAINNMITYPQWTIPESIIKKEILPALKKDAGYTLRKGYSLIDAKGNEVDPYKVQWAKYKNGIPYKVVQGSGDANALGVLKFNFPNNFSVYLHDTNQREFFSRNNRALSHGCVRVQSWKNLATFILRNDSLTVSNAVPVDSLYAWLNAKQKKYVPVRKPVPLFIRYFTCDVNDKGNLVFYDDIYDEDKIIRQKLFSNK